MRIIIIASILCVALAIGSIFFSKPLQNLIHGGNYGWHYIGGIQVNEPDHDEWISCLKKHKLNTVSVTVYAKQGKWNTSDLWFEESDQAVIDEIRAAKAQGLKVVLITRVDLDHAYPENNDLWHGMIMPRTDEDLANWFHVYNAFLKKWADIADAEGVDVMGIGSELKALTHTRLQSNGVIAKEIDDFLYWYHHIPARVHQAEGDANKIQDHYQDMVKMSDAYLAWAQKTYHLNDKDRVSKVQERRRLLAEHWSRSIQLVRQSYSGKLTYAANFDTYHNNGLWSELDVIGINAYFKLRQNVGTVSHHELQETLNESWRVVFKDMRQFRATDGLTTKPVIFTELGYTFRDNSTVEPWSYSGKSVVETADRFHLINWNSQRINYIERDKALKALKRVALKPENEFFRGLLYWKLSSVPDHKQIEPYMVYVGRDTTDPALHCLTNFSVAWGNPVDLILGRELSRRLFSATVISQ